MDWLPLDSSVFTSAAYLSSKRMLYLRFRSGELYCYFDFPPEQYRDFLAADSKGQYFAHNIRDQFLCEHLPRSRHASNST
jgi:KTSC domain